jgi:hypothetical protein
MLHECMKQKLIRILVSSIVSIGVSASAQGTFVYDQQSSDESNGGTAGYGIQLGQPLGQSFTPTLSLVGFVRLHLSDFTSGNALGATIYVNLRSDSMVGTILGFSQSVTMPDGFGHPSGTSGFADFLFPTAIPVQPGTTYYFEPVVQTGDRWDLFGDVFNYTGGTSYYQGNASPDVDYWFREGVIVPEPSSTALILVGVGLFAIRARRMKPRM